MLQQPEDTGKLEMSLPAPGPTSQGATSLRKADAKHGPSTRLGRAAEVAANYAAVCTWRHSHSEL